MLETLGIATNGLVALVMTGASVAVLYRRPQCFPEKDAMIMVAGALLAATGAVTGLLSGLALLSPVSEAGSSFTYTGFVTTLGFGLGSSLIVLSLARFIWRYDKATGIGASGQEALSVSETRLRDAIESISDGFLLLDADDRVVFFNRRYREMNKDIADVIKPGVTFEEIMRSGMGRRRIGTASGEAWAALRLQQHRESVTAVEEQHEDGRWVRVDERRTSDGGYVGIRTDITEQKKAETLLNDAIAAMSDAFALFDEDERLIVCNEPFRQSLPKATSLGLLKSGMTFEEILRGSVDHGLVPKGYGSAEEHFETRLARFRNPAGSIEHETQAGRWVRIEDKKTSSGGTVTIRTDITELKEAERLLSDAIESMATGFAVYDADERLVTCNEAYRGTFPRMTAFGLLEPGTKFEKIVRTSYENGFIPLSYSDGETYLRDQLECFRKPSGPFEFQTTSGRWIRIEERKTSNGGTVSIRTDLTERRRMEEALKEQEALLRSIVDNSPSIIVMKDLEGRYIFVNEAYATTRGVSAKAMLGKSSHAVNNPDHTEAMRTQDREVMERREAVTRQRDTTLPDGGTYKRIVTSFPVFDIAGELTGVATISTDVSELHRAQQALQESEARFRDFAESSADWFWELGPDLRFTYMSKNVERILGVPAGWHLGKRPDEFWDTDGDEVHLENHLASLKAHEPFRNFTYLCKGRGIEPKWLSISGRPIFSDDGAFLGYRGTGTDVTVLKKMENLLYNAIETMSEGFALFDADERLVICNEHYRDTLPRVAALGVITPGATFEEILRSGIKNGFLPPAFSDAEEYFESRMERFRNPSEPHEYASAAGRWYRSEDRKTPDGATVAIRTDITEQKRIELALRESEQTLREILERSPIGVAITAQARDGTKRERVFVNDAMVSMFRAGSREQMILSDISDTWVGSEYFDAVAKSVGNGEDLSDFEVLRRRMDGTEWWVSMSTRPIRFDGRDCIMVWLFDVTERKNAEDALREREALLRSVIDNMPASISLKDAQGQYLMVNKSFADSAGVSIDDTVGRTVRDFRMDESYADAFMAEDRHVLESGSVLSNEREFKNVSGHYHYSVTKFPVFDASGVVSAVGTVRIDITERKAMEEQLHQAQKMEAVGQLTGGVAHDFNNLLGVIIGNLDFLEETAGNDADRRQLIETAQRAALQGAELTNRLLAFSRKQSLSPDIVDLNALILNTTELLKRTLGETIKVRTTPAPDLKLIKIDRGQLESALLNLAVNARHAMSTGGTLSIETRNLIIDCHYVETHTEVAPGEYVMLAVSDTGTGMPQKVLKRVFEPFFTTKDVGQGSGLGLSMVFGFVKQSGGHIEIYSEPGRGTTLKLFFPVTESDAAAEAEIPKPEKTVRGSGETVLIVEDDDGLRDLAVRSVSSLGYKTVAASDGKSALAILEDDAAQVDVLFTDIVLPGGVDGAMLAASASARRPGLRVLYTSGYTEKAIIHSGIADEGIELLDKPYRREELARLLRRVLDDRPIE